MIVTAVNEHYLYPGTIFANKGHYIVTTVLGSCVSVCLWDKVKKIGGMNHFMLPKQVEGIISPRYGDSAIYQLIKCMLRLGCDRGNLIAKVFGGGNVLEIITPQISVGERNIKLARQVLYNEKIDIISSDLGGEKGRKVKYDTQTGVVSVKKISKRNFIHEYLTED